MNNIFLNNKYTNWYYSIISNSKKREGSPTDILQSHHIIPECFFLHRKRKGRKGWLLGDPDHSDNLALLTPKEHLICHILLKKMTVNEAKFKSDKAALWLIETYKTKYPEIKITGKLYQKLLIDATLARRGQFIWNNGIRDTMSVECPGNGWIKGSINKGDKKSHMKGFKAYHNGKIIKFFNEDPGLPWIKGTLQLPTKGSSGMTKWNNGHIEKFSTICPGEGWVKGRIKGKYQGSTTGKKAWNNGVQIKYSNESPGPEWTQGALPKGPYKKNLRR